MRTNSIVSAALLLGSFFSISHGHAQEGVDTGWQTKCSQEKKCQMEFQKLKGERLVAQILIYKVKDTTIMEYKVPLGVNLQKGLVFQIDKKLNIGTTPLTCQPDGCTGFAKLNKSHIASLKGGNQMVLIFGDFTTKQILGFPFTLEGFTAAYKGYAGS